MTDATAPTLAIGLDVGGTKILGGLVDGASRTVRHEVRVPTPSGGGATEILAALAEAARQLRGLAGDEPLAGIGVSSAGHVDWETGRVVSGTPNIPGWAGTPVSEELHAATGLPVCCDNDGNAAAFGEAWAGAGRGRAAIVAVTLGTGFGAGIIDRGAVVRGYKGGGAELGHMILVPEGRPCNCGQRGCVEAYVSGTALGREARNLWGGEADSHTVFDRARRGDPVALELIDEFGRHLAVTMVTIFSVADPEMILIGGGIATRHDLFLPQVRTRVARHVGGRGRFSADQIGLAALGERAGLVGAAGQALARFVPSGGQQAHDAVASGTR